MSRELHFYSQMEKFVLTPIQKKQLGFPPYQPTIGRNTVLQNGNVRTCSRCCKTYTVNEEGFTTAVDICYHHPFHKRFLNGRRIFPCCKKVSEIPACAASNTHVSDQPFPIQIEDYVETSPAPPSNHSGKYKVYAVDCEMCYTTHGMGLCSVAVVDQDLNVVYDEIVIPSNPVIDYNAVVTGITKEMIESRGITTTQLRSNLMEMWNSDTILVGHGLDSDLHALKIIHGNVIDTIAVFPHRAGLPYRRALRDVVKQYLGKDIQQINMPHSNVEDAKACMQLLKTKV